MAADDKTDHRRLHQEHHQSGLSSVPHRRRPDRARGRRAKIVHYVPKQPDNVDEQKAMVEQVLKDRPDAVVFIPVDDVAMIGSVKKLNEAKIPIVLASNPLPGDFVTFVGADDFEIGYRRRAICSKISAGKGKIVVIEGMPGGADQPRARARLQARLRRISRHRSARLRRRQLPAARRASA